MCHKAPRRAAKPPAQLFLNGPPVDISSRCLLHCRQAEKQHFTVGDGDCVGANCFSASFLSLSKFNCDFHILFTENTAVRGSQSDSDYSRRELTCIYILTYSIVLWYNTSIEIKRGNMNEQRALAMVWHMANMWLTESTQRFQYNLETNQLEDYLSDFLDSHYPQNEEMDAENALAMLLPYLHMQEGTVGTLVSQEN